MTANDQPFETKQVHAGHSLDPATGATMLPIYQISSYAFIDTAQAANRFALQGLGLIYTRLTDPTTDGVAVRITALEGGAGGLLISFDQSTTVLSIPALTVAGNNVIAPLSLYDDSVTLPENMLGRPGVGTRLVADPLDPEAWRAFADDKIVTFYNETIPNPQGDILDIEPITAAAYEISVPLAVDNTVATPHPIRPVGWGAGTIVHSTTKYPDGHGATTVGAIVNLGSFDFTSQPEHFPPYDTPDESYHGLVYARDLSVGGTLGVNLALLLRVQTLIDRGLGTITSPFSVSLVSQGIETLPLRIERHVSNALAVARFPEAHPDVGFVNYAGLGFSPYYEPGKKYTPLSTGGLPPLATEDEYETDRAFADGIQLLPVVANIDDAKSLVTHPASTAYSQLAEGGLVKADVAPGIVCLSVDLENVRDIPTDLELGFDAAHAATV